MATLNDTQSRLLELFDQIPPELHSMALDTLERLQTPDPHAGPFGWLLGYRYIETSPGHARCTLDVAEPHLNPGGVAHGGVLCTLADAAMGAAVHWMLEPDQRCVTAELKVNCLKPILPGRVTASATVLHKGGRLVVVSGEIHNEAGELVGVALGTFAIVRRTPAKTTA